MRALLAPLLALTLVIAEPAAAQFSLSGMRNSLVQFLLRQVSVEGSFEVTAEGVEQPEDGILALVGVAIADREGVWFRADSVSLRWNARRILRAELIVPELAIDGMEVLRRPIPPEVTVPENADIRPTSFDPFAWPRSPITARIDTLRIEDAFVAGGVIAEQSLGFDATGSFADEGDEQSLSLAVTRTDEVEGTISLDYLRDFATESLRLRVSGREAPGGLVAELAQLPPEAASRVDLDAQGPLADWRVSLEAEAERTLSVTGNLAVEAAPPLRVVGGLSIVPGPELDPGVAAALGETARLDLDVEEQPDGLIRLDTARFDSPGLTLTATGTVDRNTGGMDLALTLAALAPLAQAVEGADFDRLGFDGALRGTPAALEARGEARVQALATAPADVADARLATTVTRDGDRITVALDGDVQGLRLDRLTPEILGQPRLALRAGWNLATSQGSLSTLTLDSPVLALDVQGEVDLAAETAAAAYSVSAPDLAPVTAAYDLPAAGRFRADGRAEGPFATLRLSGEAALEEIAFDGQTLGQVRLTHAVTLGDPLTGEARVTAEDTPYGPASAEARFSLSGETLSLSELTAQALEATARGTATVDLSGPLATGELSIDAPRLAALSPVLGQAIVGAAAVSLSLSTPENRQRASLAVTADDVAGFDAAVRRLSLTAVVDDALGTPSATYRAEIDGLSAAGATVARIEAEGDATDLTGQPSARLTATAEGITAPDDAAQIARVTLRAEATDLTGAPALTAAVAAEDVTAGEARIAAVEADIDATDLTGAPAAIVALRATDLTAGEARIASLTADARGENLLEAPSATVSLRASELSAGDARIASVTAEAAGENLVEAPSATLSLRASDLAAGPAGVAQLTLEAQGSNLVEAPSGRAEAVASVVRIRDFGRFDTVRLTADGSAEALAVALRGAGETVENGPLTLSADARAALSGEVPTVDLTAFAFVADEFRTALARPLRITREGAATRFSGLDLTLPGGALRGSGALHDTGVQGDLTLRMDDLVPLATLADAPLDGGRLDLSARFDTRPGSASGTFDLTANDLHMEGVTAETGPLSAQVRGRWNGATLSTETEITGDFGEPLRADVKIPLAPGLPPSVPSNGGLDGRVTWRGDVGRLWAFVPAPGHFVTGQLDLDLTVGGTLQSPQPSGRLELTEGAYQFLETGTILTELTASTELLPDGGLSVRLNATDGAGGPVQAVVDLRGTQLSAKLTTDNAVLVRRDDVTASITADIAAEGPLASPLVSGRIDIERADVRLVAPAVPTLPTLGDVEIKGAPPPEEDGNGDGGPTLDLRIVADGDIWVNGRGLSSEWEADLTVTGPAASPVIAGAVERKRGTLDFLGRGFELVRGRVSFGGGSEIDPALDIALEHERADILGRISVRGFASDPEIAFESVPALPEDEVLPRVIFGASRQSLDAAQAIQLAAGVATLLGDGGGALGELRAVTGLDVIAVDTAGDDTALRLGRNVAEGVYVGVRQPLDGGEASVQVEVEVIDSITVDTETGADGASVGVNWRHDW